jgi:rod shape-determining protein MreC
MWNWLRFFKKYNFTIIFLILSIFCLWLFIHNSEIHKAYFFKISSFIVAPFNTLSSNISYYFSLKKENEELAIENLILNDRLHNSMNVKCISVSDSTFLIPDSLKNLYYFLSARLLTMTINESKNYAIIEKGRRDGISENSGVFTPNGILGIVSSVSDRYTLLKTYMHPDVKISAAINNNYVGIAQWDNSFYMFMSFAMHHHSFFANSHHSICSIIYRNDRWFIYYHFIIIHYHCISCT